MDTKKILDTLQGEITEEKLMQAGFARLDGEYLEDAYTISDGEERLTVSFPAPGYRALLQVNGRRGFLQFMPKEGMVTDKDIRTVIETCTEH